MTRLHVKKGDRVRVITGEWRGAEGVVKAVDPRRQRLTIESVNMIHRHVPKTPERPNGGVVEEEGFIHASNVKLVEAR